MRGILGRVSTLDVERDAVDRALAEVGVGWDAWPDCAASAPLDARVRLSALLLLLAAPDLDVVDDEGVVVFIDGAPEVIDRLRRRRLPWDSGAARLALGVVMGRGAFDGRRVAVALRGAETVCAAGGADVALIEALEACTAWLDGMPASAWQVPQLRLLVRRVTAAAAPPDVLDLALVRGGDAWGGLARERARAMPADDVAPLVRRLGELGSRQPSQAWLRGIDEALRPVAARDLLKSWLGLAADADVVPPDEVVVSSGKMLFAPGNEDVVRAAVLATRLLPSVSWVPQVLGVLARRGAATSGVPGKNASLALKVASAAVDTLAARGTPADLLVLEQLLADLSRRDLVKRVGAALGQQSRAAERNTELRRTKAAAVSHKADPAPRRARASVDALIRQHLGPALRRHGFQGSGRTWRRLHPDRVDVIAPGSSGDWIDLSYGTRFDAVHPDGEPYPVDRAKTRYYHLDIWRAEHWKATALDLDLCACHLEAAIVPFLDSLGRYELARSYLEQGAGFPGETETTGSMDSPVARGVVGMLALAAGDRATAVDRLARRLEFAESMLASADAQDRDHCYAEAQFWRDNLDAADRLP